MQTIEGGEVLQSGRFVVPPLQSNPILTDESGLEYGTHSEGSGGIGFGVTPPYAIKPYPTDDDWSTYSAQSVEGGSVQQAIQGPFPPSERDVI